MLHAMGRPGWDDDPAVPDWPGHAPLSGHVTADACVVGLGGSGLAAIEDLTARGLTVVGLDAGRVAAGAAGRNGGFLSCGGAMSPADPAVDLDAYAELYRATRAEQQRLADLLGPAVVRPAGGLSLAGLPGTPVAPGEHEAVAGQLERLRAEQRALASIGVKVEDYDGPLGRGYFTPDTALMNPVCRAFGLAARLPKSATLHEHSPVTGLEPGAVHTARGSVTAPVIVVAVDGKLELLLPQPAGAVQTMRLQMIATEPIAPGRVPYGVGYRDGYEWAQQDPSGRLLIGGGRDHFHDAETTTDDHPTDGIQQWIDSAAARVAGRPVTVTHRWAASAGYTPDGRALVVPIGEPSQDGRVVACGGYSGSGNLVGPIAARAAVALAVDGTAPPAYFRSSVTS